MRIAHVTSSLHDPLGGAEQYCIELATWQTAHGHRVDLFGAGASPALKTRLADLGMIVHELRRPRPYQPGTRGTAAMKVVFHGADLVDSLRLAPAVRWRLADYDVVHVHRWQGLGAAVLRLPDVPTVHTVHDYALVDTAATSLRDGRLPERLPAPQRARGFALAASMTDLDEVVFPTRRTMDRHAALGFSLAGRGDVVPHGWRLPAVRGGRVTLTEKRLKTFVFMGKLIADKGVATLLEAWGAGIEGSRLVFAGAGDLEPAVTRAAAEDRGVEYRGWLSKDEQAALLAETDVLVLPSHWPENFPLVMAEALLAGVPVLATTVSAPEILLDGMNAVIVPPSGAEMRIAMKRLAADEPRLAALRAGARVSAETLDMSRHGMAIEQVYDRALKRQRSRRAGPRR